MVAEALDRVMRSDQGRLLAVLAVNLGDLSLAEDALQDAAISAMSDWNKTGLPASPQGWLLTVARRKAIDRLRGATRDKKKVDELALLLQHDDTHLVEPESIPDERLRLIFACCHPALELKSRVALTLRVVCGLTTVEIANAFLDASPTMGQRISRAKTTIAATGIAFAVPEPQDWPTRLDAVLTTVYLIFTTGYLTSHEEPRDLCGEAEFLMRLMDKLCPDDPEIEGALAMMLLTSARRAARIGTDGASLPPSEQDRSLWDQGRVNEGREILERAVARRQPGPFQIKAAIADCQMADTGPDWHQIAALYQALWRHEPTPVVALNGAVAMAEMGLAAQALRIVEGLADRLADYQPFHAAQAALLAKTGNTAEAVVAYGRAIASAPGPAEALFLEKRLTALIQAIK